MLYNCRFCDQEFLGHPGERCPDCGASDDEFSRGYLRSFPDPAEAAPERDFDTRDNGSAPTM